MAASPIALSLQSALAAAPPAEDRAGFAVIRPGGNAS
eukprot:gene8778-8783_t